MGLKDADRISVDPDQTTSFVVQTWLKTQEHRYWEVTCIVKKRRIFVFFIAYSSLMNVLNKTYPAVIIAELYIRYILKTKHIG